MMAAPMKRPLLTFSSQLFCQVRSCSRLAQAARQQLKQQVLCEPSCNVKGCVSLSTSRTLSVFQRPAADPPCRRAVENPFGDLGNPPVQNDNPNGLFSFASRNKYSLTRYNPEREVRNLKYTMKRGYHSLLQINCLFESFPLVGTSVPRLSQSVRNFTTGTNLTLLARGRPTVADIPKEFKDIYHEQNLVNSGWLMRLANENGYLSWCRNGYLATAVAAAMMIQNIFPYSKEAAMVMLVLGGTNLFAGTGVYIYNMMACRSSMMLGKAAILYSSTVAIIHLLLWLVAVTVYLESEEVDTQEEEV